MQNLIPQLKTTSYKITGAHTECEKLRRKCKYLSFFSEPAPDHPIPNRDKWETGNSTYASIVISDH